MYSRPLTKSVMVVALVIALAAPGFGYSALASPSQHSTAPAGLTLIHAGYLTVGSDTTYPPMEFSDPDNPGTYKGADVDLATALAKAMKLKGANIEKGVFDSLIPSLNAKRYDVVMSSMNHTPARAKEVAFVDYMASTAGILVRSDSGIHANNYSQICGKKVTVERGTTEESGMMAANKKCKSKISILSFAGDNDAYQAFVSGHADAYTGDWPVVDQYAKKSKGHFRHAGRAIATHQNYGIAVRKSDTALKSALKRALTAVKKNGEYMKILKKWGVAAAALK